MLDSFSRPTSQRHGRRCSVSMLSIATFLVAATLARGQAFTPISGTLFDGSGGPLLANTTYVVTGTITVPVGQTLTINSGAGVKFNSGLEMVVNGTLNVNGTAPAPVRFTSFRDDSVGGDTNGNGASSGGAADWRGLTFNSTATVTMTQASVRYGGSAFFPGIGNLGANMTLSNVTVGNCYDAGLSLNGQAATVSVSNCTFTANGGYAVQAARLDQLNGFTNNSASGNGVNTIRISVGTLAVNRTITAANCMNGAVFVDTSIQVSTGVTLTLQAGTAFKMNGGTGVTVDGTLITNGTAGSPVYFTSFPDDSVGGDTNNNGVSSGSPTQWLGVTLNSTASASSLTRLVTRYGGGSFFPGIRLSACNATLNACRIENFYDHGLNCSNNSLPTVTGCTFTGNGNVAVTGVQLQAIPGFTNNSASGNGGSFIQITDSTMTGSKTIIPANCMNGALVVNTPLSVPAGATLTMAAGTCMKYQSNYRFQIDGTLLVNGSSGTPVIMTSIQDDSAFGDTNNNGPSAGSPTQWAGVLFMSTSDASVIHGLEVRYTGASFLAGIELRDADIVLESSKVTSTYADGINLNAGGANATINASISNCTLTSCNGYAINNVALDAVPHLLNNTGSANGSTSVHVTVGTLAASTLTVGPANGMSGVLFFSDSLTVPAGRTLAMQAGLICKFSGGLNASITGTLLAAGTAASPIYFTSAQDDSVGGDTNGNGPSSGSPTNWQGIYFNTGSSGSLLTQVTTRFVGASFVAGAVFAGGSPTLYTCTFSDGFAAGLNFTDSSSRPTVVECHLVNNGGYAVDNVPVDALQGFANNYATGNHTDVIRVTNSTPVGDLFIGPQAGIAIFMAAGLSIPGGRSVDVLPGTIIKMGGGTGVDVTGSLDVRGTGYEPVVFTSYGDDSYGGDSNGNGPSTGSPTDWRGLTYTAGATASSVENVIIRNTGSGFFAALSLQSPNVSARAVRVERCFDHGITASALSGAGMNWVANACNNAGIRLTGGGFDVVHATVTACGTGVNGTGWTGNVRNSIAWGNTTNFAAIPQARVFNSDGAFAGINGNLNVDPQFVAPATGDYHLQGSSPCIGNGDVAVAIATEKDWDEQPRLIDSTLSGTAAPEMGAFERPIWQMTVNGVSRLGATVTFQVNGAPGTSFYVLGALDGSFYLGNYGMGLAGLSPLILVALPVGTPFSVTIPQDLNLLGLMAGIQTLTALGSNPALGSTTNLYRAVVRP